MAEGGGGGGGGQGELMDLFQSRELDTSTCLAFQGLSCWEASVALCLCNLEGVINSTYGNCGSFVAWG